MKLVYLLPLVYKLTMTMGIKNIFTESRFFKPNWFYGSLVKISSSNALRITEKENSLTQKEELIETATFKPITWYALCIVGRRRIKQNAVRVEKLSRLSAHFRTTENDRLLLLFFVALLESVKSDIL